MSKRLQVVMDDAEYGEIQQAADGARLTVSAWVRRALRDARRPSPARSTGGSPGAASPPQAPPDPEPEADPDLVHAVMRRHGLSTSADAIHFALARAAAPDLPRTDLLALRGSGWSGVLSELRSGIRADQPGTEAETDTGIERSAP